MPETGPSLFADHYVLFLDFLGFARAEEDWDEGGADSLVIVLRELATARRSHGARRARGPSVPTLRKTTL